MGIEVAVDRHSGGQSRTRSLDGFAVEVAERQHGVVTRQQLLRIGLGPDAIDLRLGRGRLHVIHRGIYAVGHSVLSVDARRMAAVLASGEGAVLSHRDAAAAWGIRQSSRRRIEVTIPGRRRSRPGLQLHFSHLHGDEITTLRGIRVTTVSRTLFDLATVVPRRQVERAMHEADVRRLYDPLSLDDLIARNPRARGVAALRAILADGRRGEAVTREELEELFLAFVGRAGLPRPEFNRVIEARGQSFEADCVWRKQRVIAELDGHHVHATRRNYEGDRTRDRRLTAAGWRVIRITWRQLHDQPETVAADLRLLLARRSA